MESSSRSDLQQLVLGPSGSLSGKVHRHLPVGAGMEGGGNGSCKREESMEEGGERKQRWTHPTPRWIPPQLHAAKLHSALFKWLPPLQVWLINIGLPSISRSVESHWHFHTKAAPFLSMKIPRAEVSSPDETLYAHGGEMEALTWSGHGCLLGDGTTCLRMGPGSREDSGSSSDQRP